MKRATEMARKQLVHARKTRIAVISIMKCKTRKTARHARVHFVRIQIKQSFTRANSLSLFISIMNKKRETEKAQHEKTKRSRHVFQTTCTSALTLTLIYCFLS
jgi:hypothetical protein